MSKVHEDGHSVVDIREKLIAYPFTPGMIEAIKRFGELGVPQFILSDANSYFINALLDASGLRKYFPPHHIFTNPVRIHFNRMMTNDRSASCLFEASWTHPQCFPSLLPLLSSVIFTSSLFLHSLSLPPLPHIDRFTGCPA